jgi:hypothetical protein
MDPHPNAERTGQVRTPVARLDPTTRHPKFGQGVPGGSLKARAKARQLGHHPLHPGSGHLGRIQRNRVEIISALRSPLGEQVHFSATDLVSHEKEPGPRPEIIERTPKVRNTSEPCEARVTVPP